jgi:hypothetical protein
MAEVYIRKYGVELPTMNVEAPGSGGPKMKEGVASLEHERTLLLANELTALVKTKFPRMAAKLEEDFTDIDIFHEEDGAFLGIERELYSIPIGDIHDVPHAVTVAFRETLKESRTNKDPDPEMMNTVVMGAIDIKVAPKDDFDDSSLPTSDITLTIGRYADEKTVVGPAILCQVPKVQNSQTINDESLGMSVSFQVNDPNYVMKHILSLKRVAFSKDPELGDYALRALNELLSMAIRKLKE